MAQNLNIGQNIKYIRTQKGIKQDELATMLSVSAAAVSKWETGKTYPDITLLPKLAQVLCSSIDKLMGLPLVLSDEEVDEIFHGVLAEFDKGNFEKAFEMGKAIEQEYPADSRVKMSFAAIISMFARPAESKKQYLDYAISICEKVLKQQGEANQATYQNLLLTLYISNEEFDKAEKYIFQGGDSLGDRGSSLLPIIYFRQNKLDLAKKEYQSQLFGKVMEVQNTIGGLAAIAFKQEDYPLALQLAKTNLQIVSILEVQENSKLNMNTYSMQFSVYLKQENIDESIAAAEKTVACIMAWEDASYADGNICFGADITKESSAIKYDNTLKNAFGTMLAEYEKVDLLKDDARYKALLKKLANYLDKA